VARRVNAPVRARFPPPELGPALAYALGLAFPLVSAAVSFAMRPLVYDVPFALFIPATVFATYLGGLGPGLVSLALSATFGAYWFIPPHGAFGFSGGELGAVALFLVIGAVLCWIAAALRDGYLERAAHARRFQSLVAAIPQMVWTADTSGRADFMSPQIGEYTGRTAEELAVGAWQRHLHRDDRGAVVALWKRMRDEETGGEGTFRLLGKDGRYRWFLVRAVPLRGADGRLHQWIGTLTDIHVQKESEEAKAEAIRARDEFLSVASHELKTPVTAALLQIQHAHRGMRRATAAADLPAVTERVAASATSLERLSALVSTLLDVSHIATGKLTLERKRFDLTESVTQVVARLADSAHRVGCPLEVDVAPGVTAVGDRARVEQVITSLLANAMKYGAGSPIALALAPRKDVAVLTVADRGIGIAPEDQVRIFQPFERAASARHYGGLGLGLWIAREIIEAGGGAIRVESRPREGSTFHVELPLASLDSAAPPAPLRSG
jgi:PAS domain S-box-containing protein